MPKSPYCTRNALAAIKAGCEGSDLPVEDVMLLWTPVEARAYFESRGNTRPDPELVATRSPHDRAPRVNRTGPKRALREVLCGCLCPCLGFYA